MVTIPDGLDKISEGIQLLDVHVTEAEKVSYGERAYHTLTEAEAEAEKIEALRSASKARISELNSETKRLMRVAGTGIEMRDVPTVKCANYKTGKMITIRMDTGEEINERSLTGDEMQKRFDFYGTPLLDDYIANRFDGIGGEGSDTDEEDGGGND